jgi:uncharacterized protein YifN (PemK superfamily)
MASLKYVPERGRIVIVNFELGGASVPPEMRKPGRPCVIVQNNKLSRGPMVTVVPLSMTAPETIMPYHHRMDHRSFRDLPAVYGGQGEARWAKCDYLTTISLARCIDPYYRPAGQDRRYVKVRITQADMDAIERCVLWGLGIQPAKHVAP